MAKGAIAKEEITNKILEVFANSFKYDKEIRIPFIENGEEVQIKCVLTCAKVNVSQGDENLIPGQTQEAVVQPATVQKAVEVTAEEKANVSKMLAALGL